MHVSASIRNSQIDLPIPIALQHELEDYDQSNQIDREITATTATTRSFASISVPHRTFECPTARFPQYRPLTPPRSLENIIRPQRSQSEISQSSSNPSTPRLGETRPWHRSPPPVSDKEATPPGIWCLPHSQEPQTSQPDHSEKEVLPTPTDPAYQLRRCRYLTLPDSPEMNWFVRRSQADSPARTASIATANEKYTLDQTTGVTGYDEKQSTFRSELSPSSQIMQARTVRVNAVVDMYIEPLLQDQAANGLTRCTYVVVPEAPSIRDPASLGTDSTTHELIADYNTILPQPESLDILVGFPSEMNVKVVRLQPSHSGHTGHSGRARDAYGDQGTRFWHQPAACQELDRLLKIRLVGMGMDVIDPAGFTAPFRKDGWTERGEQVGGTPNMGSSVSPKTDRWNGDDFQAGLGIWQNGGTMRPQSSWVAASQEQLLPGQVSVKVTLEDVCFRTQSTLGLYDTKTDKAIVIRVTIEA